MTADVAADAVAASGDVAAAGATGPTAAKAPSSAVSGLAIRLALRLYTGQELHKR